MMHLQINRVTRKLASRLVLGCLLAWGIPLVSQATQIEYTITNLADTTPGEDLWQYQYLVSGYSFSADEGFFVSFDYNRYGDLEDPPDVNADWDVLVTQPDLGTFSDGTYDAQALTGNPSLADPFVVSFIWLGTGTPGAQPFELYDANFQTIEQGMTVARPTVASEPISIALLSAGLLSGFALRWQSIRRSR